MTPRQKQLLDFIDAYVSAQGYAPSYTEMGQALGTSRGTVHHLVVKLEEHGAIRRVPARSRSIRVVEDPPAQPAGAAELLAAMADLEGACRRTQRALSRVLAGEGE